MSPADDSLVIHDGRQSATAAAVQRGLCRYLRDLGFATLCEFSLKSGRRADVIALNGKGAVWIVEIKSSPADFQADNKWPDYWEFCDQLYFAIPDTVPADLMPAETGLVIADAWGAEIVRHPQARPLSPARRKALTLRFAQSAALRLQSVHDPASSGM